MPAAPSPMGVPARRRPRSTSRARHQGVTGRALRHRLFLRGQPGRRRRGRRGRGRVRRTVAASWSDAPCEPRDHQQSHDHGQRRPGRDRSGRRLRRVGRRRRNRVLGDPHGLEQHLDGNQAIGGVGGAGEDSAREERPSVAASTPSGALSRSPTPRSPIARRSAARGQRPVRHRRRHGGGAQGAGIYCSGTESFTYDPTTGTYHHHGRHGDRQCHQPDPARQPGRGRRGGQRLVRRQRRQRGPIALGGGLYNYAGDVTLSGGTFSANQAVGGAGGSGSSGGARRGGGTASGRRHL